eukprot:UN02586
MTENSNVELQLISNFSIFLILQRPVDNFLEIKMNMFSVYMRCLNVSRIRRTNSRDHTANKST